MPASDPHDASGDLAARASRSPSEFQKDGALSDHHAVARRHTAAYLALMEQCAAHLGRGLGPISERHLETRLRESDAELVMRGIGTGLLAIDGNYLHTLDPRQATAWLVEGTPAHLCWEYVPHAAAYVELIEVHGLPAGSVRFETPESEVRMSLDLVVVDPHGRVVVLGEVKMEARQIDRLAEGLLEHLSDPGKPTSLKAGGPQGLRREAWKLAHQLWQTRAPWLWLVAAGSRSVYEVRYERGLHLTAIDALPSPAELGHLATDWPPLSLE